MGKILEKVKGLFKLKCAKKEEPKPQQEEPKEEPKTETKAEEKGQ